jgi:addiction module HigA family antidote
MKNKKLHPVHPGEVLMAEFLKPLGLSQNKLALSIGVPPRRINEIVLGKRRITADTSLRLARFFGSSPEFWLGLQSQYDLDLAADELGDRLDREVGEYKRHSGELTIG